MARPSVARRPPVTKKRPQLNEPARWQRIWRGLEKLYPDVHCELTFDNPFQLLIATILSAQCTDKRVNMVTPTLFAQFPTPSDLAEAPLREVEKIIQSTGFYRNKAKNIVGAARVIMDDFSGRVPETMDELLTLPGVARKTANVVLGTAFGKNEGVVVDTHVGRLSRRLALTRETQPQKVEIDLCEKFERTQWTLLAHRLIWHGRRVCFARKPQCEVCLLAADCPSRGVA